MGFIPPEDISNNFVNVSQMVKTKGSEDSKFNITTNDLNEAAKMFFTLNFCPSLYEKLYWKAIYINGPNSRITMLG